MTPDTAESILIDSEDQCVIWIEADRKMLEDFKDYYFMNQNKEIEIKVLFTEKEHIMNSFRIISEKKYMLEFSRKNQFHKLVKYRLISVKELVGNVLCIVQLERKQFDREYKQVKLDVIDMTQSYKPAEFIKQHYKEK